MRFLCFYFFKTNEDFDLSRFAGSNEGDLVFRIFLKTSPRSNDGIKSRGMSRKVLGVVLVICYLVKMKHLRKRFLWLFYFYPIKSKLRNWNTDYCKSKTLLVKFIGYLLSLCFGLLCCCIRLNCVIKFKKKVFFKLEVRSDIKP